MRWTKKKNKNKANESTKNVHTFGVCAPCIHLYIFICIHFAIQHALLPFICRKISNKFTFPLYMVGAMSLAHKVNDFWNVPTIGVMQCFCAWIPCTQMNKTKQSTQKNVYNIYNENGKRVLLHYFYAVCVCYVDVQYRFFRFFFSFFDDDIIAFILGCEWSTLPSYHFSSFCSCVRFFCFAPTVIFSFFYKCSGCEMCESVVCKCKINWIRKKKSSSVEMCIERMRVWVHVLSGAMAQCTLGWGWIVTTIRWHLAVW